MKTELILLAAGQSKRFGGIKQLAGIQGQPMICHCLSQYRQGEKWIEGIADGHVALGANAALISEVIPHDVHIHVVDSWQRGMGYTLAESMQLIANDTTHVLIGLADQVSISQKVVSKMLVASNRYPHNIISAEYAGSVGAPCIFPRQFFSELCRLTGDKGAKLMLQQYRQQVISIDMPEAAFDIDTPEDLNVFLSDPT